TSLSGAQPLDVYGLCRSDASGITFALPQRARTPQVHSTARSRARTGMAQIQNRAAAPGRLVGRKAELEAIDAALASPTDGAHVVVSEGDAGIGKARLLQEAVRGSRGRGYRVLSCSPVESEAHFAFAALTDLLAGAVDESRAELPDPQRRALEAALLLADSAG